MRTNFKKKLLIVAVLVVVAVTLLLVAACSHSHTLTAVARKDATCTEKGNEAYWKCDDCGKMFSDSAGKNEIKSVPEIAAKGHSVPSFTETVNKPLPKISPHWGTT